MEDKTSNRRLGFLPFIVAGMSFIPLFGILFGLIAIVWGFLTKKAGGKKLAAVGGAGICFTVIIYGSLIYFGLFQRNGVYDELRSRMAQSNLNTLVQSIEFYKLQNGNYPKSLKVLRESLPKDSFVFTVDSSATASPLKPSDFYYKLIGSNHYYLLGVGTDGKPFTADDVLPNIKAKGNGSVGLLIKDNP